MVAGEKRVFLFAIYLVAGALFVADAATENKNDDSILNNDKKGIAYESNTMDEILEKIKEDSSYFFNGFYFERELQHHYVRDSAFCGKVYDFYIEVMNKSKNPAMIHWAMESALRLARRYPDYKANILKKEKIILTNDLSSEFIDVRLNAADRLFDLGFQEDAFPVYKDFLKGSDTKNWVDKEYQSQHDVRFNAVSKKIEDLKRKPARNKKEEVVKDDDIDELERNLETIKREMDHIDLKKISVVQHVFSRIIIYKNHKELYGLVKRTIGEDPWVDDVIHNTYRLFDTTKGVFNRSGKYSPSNKIDDFIKNQK